MHIKQAGAMKIAVYDPDKDGQLALAQLVAAVCSETEATALIDAAITKILKTADETVNNSAALQNDDELLFPVVANATWFFILLLRTHSPTTTPDMDYAFSIPVAGAIKRMEHAVPPPAVEIDGTAEHTLNLRADTDEYTPSYFLYIGGVNGGNVQLQWAQNVATAEDTKVLANSFILAFRLA